MLFAHFPSPKRTTILRDGRVVLGALTAALLFLGNTPGAAADVTGLARVIDGDTLEIAGEKIRLYGIDAPESKQTCEVAGVDWDCGHMATLNLASTTAGQDVTCKEKAKDRYGRTVAICYLGDEDLNARMVQEGWAVAYRKYSKAYVADETEARTTGAGIWKAQFVEPWEWRKERREAQHAEAQHADAR